MLYKSVNEVVKQVEWQLANVISPSLEQSVSVIVAKDIPYIINANRLQNLTIYLPKTAETSKLIGSPALSFPNSGDQSSLPRYHVHIHGGAWRASQLTSSSIEATVAQAFKNDNESCPIKAVASLNYTVSQFPTHPETPYDAIKENHTDPSREAVHPQHISDILHGLNLLRSFGLKDKSYILSGHSSGACTAFQTILQSPAYYGLDYLADPPVPAALLGLNGLYDLPALLNGLDPAHEHLQQDYRMILNNAFGSDIRNLLIASPSRFDPEVIAKRILLDKVPNLVVLDHSKDDELSPRNQSRRMMENLSEVSGLNLVIGNRCTGKHSAPWEQGLMIWQSIKDILLHLQKQNA